MRIRVIKIGGSLLSLPDFATRLTEWLNQEQGCCNLLIVGGGEVVESIRGYSTIHHFREQFSHWVCIDLLEVTHQMLLELVPELNNVRTPTELYALQVSLRDEELSHRNHAIAISSFYHRRNHDKLPAVLPQTWETTSDSLAALLAIIVQANELVLLKSCDIPACLDASTAAKLGLVDPAFPELAGQVPHVRMTTFASIHK